VIRESNCEGLWTPATPGKIVFKSENPLEVVVQYADFQEAQEALSPDQTKLLVLEVM
jgi:hypothetical protein